MQRPTSAVLKNSTGRSQEEEEEEDEVWAAALGLIKIKVRFKMWLIRDSIITNNTNNLQKKETSLLQPSTNLRSFSSPASGP